MLANVRDNCVDVGFGVTEDDAVVRKKRQSSKADML